MSIYDNFQEIRSEVERCMKCGNCTAVCPVYKEDTTEAGVARGKIALAQAVLDGKLELNQSVIDRMSNCLICMSCMTNCPCRVKFDKIALAMRAEMKRKKGLHPIKKVIFGTLKRPALFDLGLKIGSRFQPLIFKHHADINANSPRFPMGLDMKRIVPPLAKTPFRDAVPETIKVDKPVKRVAFFTGCSLNYMSPEIGHSLVNVLKENNVEVVVPKGQHCCGLVVWASGDIETARDMARSNIDIMDKYDVDAIVVACGSCGGSWKHGFHEVLAEDPVYSKKAEAYTTKTYDISEFLTKVVPIDRAKLGNVDVTITYHDSCHLKKGANVFVEPRNLLNSIPGLIFNEMKKPDACCGGGGSFSITNYDMSMKINKRKIEDINGTGAKVVITGCPGCRMHIADGINRFGNKQEVLHTMQVLDQAYQNGKKKK